MDFSTLKLKVKQTKRNKFRTVKFLGEICLNSQNQESTGVKKPARGGLVVGVGADYAPSHTMAIQYHPEPGTILICDFRGYETPEMLKRRPVVVISPRLRHRTGLCTIVPLSTSTPMKVEPYHYRLHTIPPMHEPYNSPSHWVKADMVYTVSFNRLFLMTGGKDQSGKRIYDNRIIDKVDLLKIQAAVLCGLGLTPLTDYL